MYMWDSIEQSHMSHMGQKDRRDTWDSRNTGTCQIALDSLKCPTWHSVHVHVHVADTRNSNKSGWYMWDSSEQVIV